MKQLGDFILEVEWKVVTLALWINKEYVGDETFIEEFQKLGGLEIDPHHPSTELEASKLRRLAEQRAIGRILLRQQAIRQGISVTANEVEVHRREQWGTSSASVCSAAVLRTLGENLLVQKYCDWLTRHEPRASRTEVEAFYQQRREQFRVGEQVQLMQVIRTIYLPREEETASAAIQAAHLELEKGSPFEKVANRYSDCSGKAPLGWIQRGEMVAAFDDVAFSLAKGQRSGIFRTVFGLHILLAIEKRSPGYRPFEEVRPMLAKQLLQMRKEQRINAQVAEAVRCATIVSAPFASEYDSSGREASSHG